MTEKWWLRVLLIESTKIMQLGFPGFISFYYSILTLQNTFFSIKLLQALENYDV